MAVLDRVAELGRHIGDGPAWVAFVRAARGLHGTEAGPAAGEALCGEIEPTDVGDAFRRSLYGAWLDRVIPIVPVLADFRTAAHEDYRRLFHQLDSQLLKENRAKLVETLRGYAQSRYASSDVSHRQFLQREMAKQKRHRPLRVTLREAHGAVSALKPCFLMSPMSVSQFLSPEMGFDLVIFDEASQLPTEDAIAAVCRGKQLVVVGDPKQLPPTDFFTVQTGAANVTLDENGDPVLEETESVLEEFQAAGLHQAHLEWHYRSVHQSLIQFSNELFYGNRLLVFPSALAETPQYGLRFEYIPDGRYEGAGLNVVEARRVAAAVVEHFRKYPHESLGVGTFNLRQQLAILDELERHRRADPSLEEFFSRSVEEPFFAKNLENVQGDERDVIFLSITYGKQADGKLRYNFGPLNREHGWRRLNVLVSRARRRMVVFSSLRSTDVDPRAVTSQGPGLLADFLRFAETGRLATTAIAGADAAESPFESEVMDAVEQMGYLVDTQVGVGSYRIDLGVRVRERPGRFIAGIECDGAAYHSAPCARDRDRLRQMVLENRGWTIVRVWSTDWFKDRRGSLERLKRTLDDLRVGQEDEDNAATGVAHPTPEPLAPEDPDPPAEVTVPRLYLRPRVPSYGMAPPFSPRSASLLEARRGEVVEAIVHFVSQESPIHIDDLVDRILNTWGHRRRGNRLVAEIDAAIRTALELGRIVARGGFLYNHARDVKPRNRSYLSVGAERVAPEELQVAATLILGAADAMDEAELIVEIREMLGLRRTQEGTPRLQEAIQALVDNGAAIYGAAGLRLRTPEA